jgi:hypothetical protein
MIFREDAVQHYIQRREASVLPRFVSPPTFLCLWAMLGLLVTSGLVAWITPVPVFASGAAVVVAARGKALAGRDEVMVVAFLPSEHLSCLRVGQRLLLKGDSGGQPISAPVVAVAPAVRSPEAAQKEFGLTAGAALAIRRPSAVAIARWTPIRGSLADGPLPPASAYSGTLYRADIQVGARRLISFLPLVGRFWGSRS